jgi:uncharacterized protein (TIGR03905 family)
MKPQATGQRYIYRTAGVCPPEIHFRLDGGKVAAVRFVGGGCPGNATLVSRLLDGQPLANALALLEGIDCRNATSCPDQLAQALRLAAGGGLPPAPSFRVDDVHLPGNRLALVADPRGRVEALDALIGHGRGQGLENICCLGDLTGTSRAANKALLKQIRRGKLLAVTGAADYRRMTAEPRDPSLRHQDRDELSRTPQVLIFHLNGRRGVVFQGAFLQDLPGYSDYDPMALEINMLCGLTDFLRDETVKPALSAMIPQFQAQIVVFSQNGNWGHWTVDGVDLIGVGPAIAENELAYGLIEVGETARFERVTVEPVNAS